MIWIESMMADSLNMHYRTWRSSLIIAFISCYLMWAITFLAQLNPLIAPKRSDWRAEFVHE